MQHKVTVFDSISSSIPKHYEVIEVLNSIKRGKNKQLIEKIRNERDKEQRDRLKKQLYCICFSGEFKKRLNEELVLHSGLMCIDFDNFPNKQTMEMWRNKVKNSQNCFSIFTSPSGNGLKALIRIPVCSNNDEHNYRFEAIAESFFDCPYFDKNGKGVARICYESYDPNIFINQDAVEFTHIKIPEVKNLANSGVVFDTDITDIFTKLIVWFESKFNLRKGSRNENLFYLFSACRDYCLDQNTALILITDYARTKAEDFKSIEQDLPQICKSAFSRPSANKKMAKMPTTDIASEEDLSISIDAEFEFGFEETHEEYEAHEDCSDKIPNEKVIWKLSNTGTYRIDFLSLKKFLQEEGFYRYEVNERDFIFVRVIENTVQEQDVRHIKDFLLKCLEKWEKYDVYNMIAENTKFKKEYLNYLDPIKINWNRDTKETGWIYFNNVAVKVTEDKIEPISYIDLDGYIWKTQKINRNFRLLKQSDAEKTDFCKFVNNICAKDDSRINSMRSAIGYLMHSFKSKSTAKAVIFNDEIIADEAMGGTGKGLTMQVIASLKNTVIIPGADFDTGKDFAWQRVNLDTAIVAIDDVEKNFKYKKLFTFLTDGWPIRKLYQGEFFMKPEDSPKIVVLTNYTLKGDTDSYARRKFELELHPHYSKNYQPIDDFKKEFISEWNDEEKNMCDNYLLYCLKYFLKNGLLEPNYVNLKYKKLLINTSIDFISFAEEHLKDNYKFNKKDLFSHFQQVNSLTNHDYPNQKVFTQWAEYWGNYNGYYYNSRFGSGGMYLIYGDGKNEWRKNNLPF